MGERKRGDQARRPRGRGLLVSVGKAESRARKRVEEQIRQEAKAYEVKSEAIAEVKKARVRIPRRPLTPAGKPLDPSLPHDITKVSNHELGKLLGQFAAVASYMGSVAALRDVERTIKKSVAQFVRLKLYLELDGKHSDKKAEAETHPYYMECEAAMLRAEMTSKLTQSILDSCLQGKEACSREITRRTGLEMDRGR